MIFEYIVRQKIIFFVFAFLVCVFEVGGQVLEPAITDDCSSVRQYFVESMIRANRTGGIVLSNAECPKFSEPDISLMTLDESLSAIFLQYPNFRNEYDNGSSNLFSSSGSAELLETEVQNFTYDINDNFSITIDKLLRLAEVQAAVRNAKMREGVQFGGLQSPPRKYPNIDLRFEKTTLRQILNAIARIRGRGVWMYRESFSVSSGKTFSLKFIAQ